MTIKFTRNILKDTGTPKRMALAVPDYLYNYIKKCAVFEAMPLAAFVRSTTVLFLASEFDSSSAYNKTVQKYFSSLVQPLEFIHSCLRDYPKTGKRFINLDAGVVNPYIRNFTLNSELPRKPFVVNTIDALYLLAKAYVSLTKTLENKKALEVFADEDLEHIRKFYKAEGLVNKRINALKGAKDG